MEDGYVDPVTSSVHQSRFFILYNHNLKGINRMRLQTLAVHSGVDKDTAYNSVITPIYQTSTFRFEDVGKTKGYDYTRTANPTRKALEENIASLEGGAGAKAVATGMAASLTALHLLKAGDHLVVTNDCYGGTERLLRTYRRIIQI